MRRNLEGGEGRGGSVDFLREENVTYRGRNSACCRCDFYALACTDEATRNGFQVLLLCLGCLLFTPVLNRTASLAH